MKGVVKTGRKRREVKVRSKMGTGSEEGSRAVYNSATESLPPFKVALFIISMKEI